MDRIYSLKVNRIFIFLLSLFLLANLPELMYNSISSIFFGKKINVENKRGISSRKPALKYTHTSAAVFRATCLLLCHVGFVTPQGGGKEIDVKDL